MESKAALQCRNKETELKVSKNGNKAISAYPVYTVKVLGKSGPLYSTLQVTKGS